MRAGVNVSGLWNCIGKKRGTCLFLLNESFFPLYLTVSPLSHTSGQAPLLRTLTARLYLRLGRESLEVLGERPGHLVAQGAYTGKAVFI